MKLLVIDDEEDIREVAGRLDPADQRCSVGGIAGQPHGALLHLQPREPGIVGQRAAQGFQHDGHGRLPAPLLGEPGEPPRAGLAGQGRRGFDLQLLQLRGERTEVARLLDEAEGADGACNESRKAEQSDAPQQQSARPAAPAAPHREQVQPRLG